MQPSRPSSQRAITRPYLKADCNRAFVNARDNTGISLLHAAAQIGCSQIVEHLLNYGAYVNCICMSRKGYTPLHFPVGTRNKEVITLLLSRGANVDVKAEGSITPLHIAAGKGNEEAVKLLLNRGADINASTKGNLMPLHFATRRGHGTVVNLLLQHGARVDNQDGDAETVLHSAVITGYFMIVEDVLKYCPDINNQSNRALSKPQCAAMEKGIKRLLKLF
ncbi:poly [ADP-ribose] polymerase tankyrase-2-like [Hylaeus volcanicus]|uniref:poly [ADP-ribose] polymerase tankyrase-2-like n=1 Tax=Hylaeus volcanicus TaxID=313075 RepID=UPI0023B80BA6|nr:poly [ADP-ribose] polymerase tankyrase-2-like [Hylaeus volcanicus]